ncbi:MAG: AAA domain-containing protein [Bacteroidota bacterium]
MTPPHPDPSISLFPKLAESVRNELDALSKQPHEITLCSGEFIGSFAGMHYYRFEIPENVSLRGILHGRFTFGRTSPIELPGTFIAVENQYLTVALPKHFGPVIPETDCRWEVAPFLSPIIDRLAALDFSFAVSSQLLHPSAGDNHHAVGFEFQILPSTPSDQKTALERIVQNRLTFVWGPILSGKTHLLAHIAANYVKAGKTILFVDTVNERVDDVLLRSIEIGQQLGIAMVQTTGVVGFPAVENFEKLGPISLEQQAESMREEKRRSFQERAKLLDTYWRVRIKQVLHEDETLQLAGIREKVSERKKLIDQTGAEIAQLREAVGRIQKASMMEKLKKGFAKDELVAAQKKLDEKLSTLKRLQSTLTALAHASLRIEAHAPISGEDQKEFNLAVKGIEELGSLAGVEEAVRQYTSVDEQALLDSKMLVGTTLTTALCDPRLRGKQFDMVMVDDAESIPIPYLTALASMAREKMVVSGDPYQLGPESSSNTPLAQEWLQRDIFLQRTGGERLPQLFDYTEKNAQSCILLSSHFATTPKLSLFVGSILFDDKINVFASPNAKGRIFVVDTSALRSLAKQYIGRKKIIPYNDQQTRKVLELVKHALMEPGRTANDVGVILPFSGPTMHTRQQLRAHGIQNVEVGTPHSFQGRRKKAIIFDTVMAGVDYTMRPIDDKKVGEHQIVRLLNTVFSCVEEDLYVVVDINHLNALYKDRLFNRLLTLLRSQADPGVNFAQGARDFDQLEWDQKAIRTAYASEPTQTGGPVGERHSALKDDAEFAVQMKMMAKKNAGKQEGGERNYERETYMAVHRVLGLIADVNLLAPVVGHKLLFHHSYETEQALAKLPITVARSEREFQTVMEEWNLLVYEKSGGSKSDVMFFKNTPETRVRWDVNTLKAFYSAEVDSVVEEGKQKIAMAVSRIFQECLGKPKPASPDEWHTGYMNFLGKLEAYLAWISEQMRK